MLGPLPDGRGSVIGPHGTARVKQAARTTSDCQGSGWTAISIAVPEPKFRRFSDILVKDTPALSFAVCSSPGRCRMPTGRQAQFRCLDIMREIRHAIISVSIHELEVCALGVCRC